LDQKPEVGKRTTVEFLAYQYKDEAQYTHTGNSWFHLHRQEEFTEDAYMTRLSDQIDNDNEFGLAIGPKWTHSIMMRVT